MKPFVLVIVCAVIAYGVYEILRLVYLAHVSRGLILHAEAFERTEGTRSLLLLGDSTAVGVGVKDSAQTVAGRLSNALNLSVENQAESGAVTTDLARQLSEAKKEKYDLILIQVGANDVIDLRDLDDSQADLKRSLADAAEKSDHIALLTAGKIGEAPLFPWFARSFLTKRAADLRERIKPMVESFGAVYVDLYAIEDPFATDTKRYYAPDGLHLTGDGYAFWYEQVKKAIDARWPRLYE